MVLATAETKPKRLPSTPWGELPPRMRMLFITGHHRTGGWLAEAFASDSASEVLLEEAVGLAAGLARLRDDVFDAVLISHEKQDLDALELLGGLRTSSSNQQAIIVLGARSEQEMSALCYEVGADAYVCANTTTTRTLIWQVARAMERHRLIAENRILVQDQRRRLQHEHEEAERLLSQQRALIADLEKICTVAGASRSSSMEEDPTDGDPAAVGNALPLSEPLLSHYRELLRAYVVMGTGNLSEEMDRLAELLTTADMTARQAMTLHLHVLEEMVHGLGSRSARHVMNRADLLIMEVVIKLAESYRQRYRNLLHPARQLELPGFTDPPSTT